MTENNKKIKQDYNEALEFLFSQLPMFSRTGAPAYKPGLDTSLQLSRYFNDPHKKFKSIHVGGTNGKGSTSHILASVLQSAGYKTGLYTSPHLADFRERMRINGKMIPQDKVVEFTKKWRESDYDGKPSFFELTMIMAFNWFAEEKIDYAVIEVGMGGRLDSTNIITPLVSVITNISYDHNQFLGNTLPEIAGEKAGIIKQGIPVVIGEKDPETSDVFLQKAEEEGAPIIFADTLEEASKIEKTDKGWLLKTGEMGIYLPLGGDYQKKNFATALAAIGQMRKAGMKISDDAIISGFRNVVENTGLSGRWMVLSENPLTIADTGHNIAGITYNFSQLKELQKERGKGKLRVIIGFVADKAIEKILKLLPRDAEYYVTQASIPRALDAGKLLEMFEANGLKAERYENVFSAYQAAQKAASEKDIIFIGGSTFIVADLLAALGKDS